MPTPSMHPSTNASVPDKARRWLRRDPSKVLLVGFLALLVISVLQVGYWVAENISYTMDVEQRLMNEYRADAQVVADFMANRPPISMRNLMPHLAIDSSTGAVTVRADALAALDRARTARVNRYLWEGSFFIVVLIAGITVLARTIRHDEDLRRRQQNFLAAVSHEFKSPLASMRLATETLLMRTDSPDTKRLGQRLLEDGERLLRMVDNLLDTTRLEEGRRILAPEAIDVRVAIGAGVAEVEERAKAHGIAVSVAVDEPRRLWVDPGAFETILRNLLDNAVKAVAANEGQRITVLMQAAPGRVELVVNDDGLGFPPEEAVMIFAKFHRLGDELQRSTRGTGLGLYIVKRLVGLSGATIHATSPGPGKGATFTVAWPEHYRR